MFSKNIFRNKAMERLTAPDEFDEPVKIISIKSWLFFLLFLGVSFAIVVWIFFSRINQEIDCKGIIIKENKIIEVHTLTAGLIDKIFVKSGSNVKKGEALLNFISASSKEKLPVTSPTDGSLFEMNVSEGNFSNLGDKLFSIEKRDTSGAPGDFEVTGFVPGKIVSLIKKGSSVLIAPKNIDIKEYGYLLGVVKKIANYPVSQERKNLLVKENPSMTEFLQDEFFEVIITPQLENNQLKWSSKKGSGIKSVNSTTCDLKIIVNQENISGFMFK